MAKIRSIYSNPFIQQVGLLSLNHYAQDLVVKPPGSVLVNAQISAKFKLLDSSLGLANQIVS
jgi:hypothetical protein